MPGQTDSQVDASRCKFAKPELAYGLAMGGQTDSQVGSQVHTSRKKSYISRIYSLLATNLCTCRLEDWKTWVDLRTNLSSTKVNGSHRKSTQVSGQMKRKLNVSRKLALTCVDLRVRLARVLWRVKLCLPKYVGDTDFFSIRPHLLPSTADFLFSSQVKL